MRPEAGESAHSASRPATADGLLTKNGRIRVPEASSQATTAPAASPIRPAHTIARRVVRRRACLAT
ncbi:hypothetical protein ACFQ0B_68440 [Nonomuraea thailandensis]